jgi:hypothetical protein
MRYELSIICGLLLPASLIGFETMPATAQSAAPCVAPTRYICTNCGSQRDLADEDFDTDYFDELAQKAEPPELAEDDE